MQGKLEQTGRDSYVQFKWGEYIYLKKDTYQTCAPHITQASHISWHWWEWWQRFQKILHLSWNRFYLTKGISTSWLGCRLLLRKFNRSCRKDKERCCNKDHYKITKIKSHFLSDGENKKRLIALLLQKIKKKCLTECSENTTDDLLHEQECVSLKLIGCSPYPQMLSNYGKSNIKFIVVTMEAL